MADLKTCAVYRPAPVQEPVRVGYVFAAQSQAYTKQSAAIELNTSSSAVASTWPESTVCGQSQSISRHGHATKLLGGFLAPPGRHVMAAAALVRRMAGVIGVHAVSCGYGHTRVRVLALLLAGVSGLSRVWLHSAGAQGLATRAGRVQSGVGSSSPCGTGVMA